MQLQAKGKRCGAGRDERHRAATLERARPAAGGDRLDHHLIAAGDGAQGHVLPGDAGGGEGELTVRHAGDAVGTQRRP